MNLAGSIIAVRNQQHYRLQRTAISQWMCNIKKECSVSCPIDDLSLVAFVDDIRSISLAMLNSSQNRRWRCLSLIHSTRSVYVMNSGFSLSQDIQFCPQLKCIQAGVKGTQTVLYTSLKSLLVEPFVYTVGSGVENLEVILPKHSANCLVIVSCLLWANLLVDFSFWVKLVKLCLKLIKGFHFQWVKTSDYSQSNL